MLAIALHKFPEGMAGGVGLGGIKLENVNVLGRIVVSGTSLPSSVFRVAMVSVTLKEPLLMSMMVPLILGGTMILWSTTAVSGTVPMISPPVTLSPTLALGETGRDGFSVEAARRGSVFSSHRGPGGAS